MVRMVVATRAKVMLLALLVVRAPFALRIFDTPRKILQC
jgi:hypothetical protein